MIKINIFKYIFLAIGVFGVFPVLATIPTTSNNTVAVDEDQTKTFIASEFPFSDVDGNSLASVKIVSLPANGTLQYNLANASIGQVVSVADLAAGLLKFIPQANANGTAYDSFQFTVIDNNIPAEESTAATMTIDVNPINDPPTAASKTLTTPEDNALTINASDFSFSDVDGHTFASIRVENTVVAGTLKNGAATVADATIVNIADINAGNLVFTPALNGNGEPYASFTFRVFDSSGDNSGIHTITINVTSVNDLPTSSSTTTTTLEDTPKTFAAGDFPFSDIDGGLLTKIQISNLNITGTLQLSSTDVINGQEILTSDIPNLVFTPVANGNGSGYASFDFKVHDGTDYSIATYTLTIDVTAVNDPPTINPVTPPSDIYEDAALQSVTVTGISAGGNETPPPTVTATSSNLTLIPTPTVNYNSSTGEASISYQPEANQNGSSLITVTVDDGSSQVQESWTVNVLAVNDKPTVNTITNQSTNEDTNLVVNLAGLSPGPNETGQFLTITASSDNGLIVPDGVVTYTQGNSTGSITFSPAANAVGTANITLTVSDNGGVVNPGDDDTKILNFQLQVLSVNDPPTLADITSPASINEDAGLQSVGLTAIDDGDPEVTQTISINATSDNLSLIETVNVNYTSPAATATLSYTPKPNAYGTATISVDVHDGLTMTTKTFVVKVDPVNDPPTLDPITGITDINEDAPTQSVSLSGITAGPNEPSQSVSVTASSNMPGIIPDPTASYNSGSGTWSISYTPVANQYGSVIITVTVTDDDANQKSASQSFTQNVLSVNDPPTLDPVANIAINEDAPLQTTTFSGVTDDGLAPKNLVVTATSSDVSIIQNPTVNYTSPNASGSISFTPQPNAFGNVTITLKVTDKDGLYVEQPFDVAIAPINDAPTINNIPSQPNLLEDAGSQSITLSGIGPGPGESESVVVSAASDNTALISSPAIINNAGTYSLNFTPGANANGTAVLTVTVDDQQSTNNQTSKTVTINVLPVNDIPSFDILGDQAVSENSGLTTINTFASNISDGDPEVQSLTFQTTLGATTGNLAFDIVPSVDLATGNLSFQSAANTNGNVSVTVTLRDNGGTTNGGVDEVSKNFKIYVTAVNEPPSFVLNGNPPAVNEDVGPVTEAAFAQSIDDGDPELTQTLTFNVSQAAGTLAFASAPAIDPTSGDLTYTPAANANGIATFDVTLQETVSGKLSTTSQFTITVNAVNDPPVGGDISLQINEDQTYTFQATDFIFSDLDNHAFQGVQITTLPVDGALMYNGAAATPGSVYPDVTLLTFTPGANENGTSYAVVGFKVRDESGDLSTASYNMTIDVLPAADDPFSAASSVNTPEDQTYTFAAIDFPFSDADGDAFNGIIIQSGTDKGTLLENSVAISGFPATITDVTKLQFQPVAAANGTPYTSFSFDVRDATGATSASNGPYTMTINVGAVNDPPVGSNETKTILEDQTYAFQSIDFTFSDPDGHLFDGIQVTQIPASGTLLYNGTAVMALDICQDVTLLTYTPPQNQNGTALTSFNFKVRDNSSTLNVSISEYTMTINVTAVNDAPVFTITENPPAINEDAGGQTVAAFISTIDDGDAETTQNLTFNLTYTLPATLSFTSPPTINKTTGDLTYAATADSYGTVVIDVTLSDDGGTANGGTNISAIQQFTLTVNPINDPPTLDNISDISVDEDAVPFLISLSGISAGTNESQTLTITATSSDTSVIKLPVVNYTSPANTGQLTLTPKANANGTSTITVTVDDGEPTNHMVSKAFLVTVNAINDTPTIQPIPDPAQILEDANAQTINLAGISAGPGETQTLTVTATTDNPQLIQNIIVTYSSPDAIGSISYQPVANKSGSATIDVTVTDNGSPAKSATASFLVQVTPVNDPPTLDDFTVSTIDIDEDAGTQSLTLTGISPGGGENQPLAISATSEFPLIIPTPTVGTIIGGQAIMTYTPVANKNGLVKISVTVDDGQSMNNTVTKEFFVNIRSVNDAPTLNPIVGSPFTLNEDDPLQNLTLTGISAGGGESQTLSVYAVSDDVNIVQNPSINFTQGNSSAVLSYIPEPDKSGTVNITVYVDDLSGASNNLVSQIFTVQINPVNDPPTINDIVPPADLNEDAPQQTIALSGISPGGGESQSVTITAVSLNPAIVGDPTINYSGNNNGTLLFSPLANANGTATIQVTVDDGQSTNNITVKTFSVNILKVNDQPTLDAIASPLSINEDAGTQTIGLSGISPGPNESEQSITITAVSDNTNLIPNPSINAKSATTRDLLFTPLANKNGTATISVTVDDGQPANNQIIRTFVVNVSAVNDPPGFSLNSDINITENAGVQNIPGYAFNISDGDPELSQGLTFNITSSGSLSFKSPPTLSAANGDLTFETAQNSNGTATVTVTLVDDGTPPATSSTHSFNINVLPINGKPSFTLTGDPPVQMEDAGPITITSFSQNMDDGDPELDQTLTFNISKISGALTFSTNPILNSTTGTLSYQTAQNSFGTALISVTLSDDGGATSNASFFSIIVNPVNDPPVGANENVTTDEDIPYSFAVGDFTYSDVESNGFAGIQIVNLESNGDLEYNGTDVTLNQICPNINLLVFKPGLNATSNATFGFKLRDAEGSLSSAYQMTISINPVPDNPTSASAEVNTLENTPYTFKKGDFPYADPDGDAFSAIKIFSLETRGALKYNNIDVMVGTEITNFSQLVFTPVPSENGTPYSSFQFQVKDGTNRYSTEYTMSIVVGATNDRPTGANESVTFYEDNNYTFKTSDFTFNDLDGDLFDGITVETLETQGDLEYNGSDIVSLPTLCPDVTKLVFKPGLNENGTGYASFTFRVKDNSASLNTSSQTYTMTLNVNAVNDKPVFTLSGNPPAINEDDGTQSIAAFASSINDGDADQTQTLQFTVQSLTTSSGNLTFSSAPTISLTGTLSYQPTANTYGTASFSVFLTDNGGTSNGGQNKSDIQNFTITVNAVNDAPTLNPIADRPAIPEDAATQSVSLTNITAGPMENQAISITVSSSNTALIPTPTVNYTSPNNTGSISYTPVPNQSGSATITVTASDGQANNGTISRSFLVIVSPVNDPPTLNDISNPDPILENAAEQVITATGITAGGGESQTLTVSATSSNTLLIPTVSVSYPGGTTAQLAYTPTSNTNGTSTITVTVDDGQGKSIQKTFVVTVSPVNDAPTIDPIANPAAISEDAVEQQVSIAGITAGQNESQPISISATSSNTSLINNIIIDYTSPATTGKLRYQPAANQFGNAIITVTVNDGAALNNKTSQQFEVIVNPVADPPQVTDAFTDEGVQTTSGLVISRNSADGNEVSYFKITNIKNGSLFQQDGSTTIIDGEFITVAEGMAGLRFTPSSGLDGSFDIQGSLLNTDAGLGGGKTKAHVIINSIPTTTDLPNLTLNEDTPPIVFDLFQAFNDAEDADIDLTFTLVNSDPNLASAVISGQVLTISLKKDKNGTSFIKVICTDKQGASVEDYIQLDIIPVDDAPAFTSTPINSASQGVAYTYEISTSDAEDDARKFDWIAPPWLMLDDHGDGTATLFGTPAESDNGPNDIEVVVTETNGTLSTKQNFTINVNNVNDPPYFVSQPDTFVLETEKYEYLIEVADPDANDSYTVYLDPASQTINWLVLSTSAPYKLEGFPPVGSAGTYDITIFVIDQAGLIGQQNFIITVSAQNNLPTISNLPTIQLDEDQSYQFDVDAFKDAFADNDQNDSLNFITIASLPLNGSLSVNGQSLSSGDTIWLKDISNLIFNPEPNFNGLNFFEWNASDGKSLALTPAKVFFNIIPQPDPPELSNLETQFITYDVGDTEVLVTQSIEVSETDDGKIASGTIAITSNYNPAQDSLFIDAIDGITSSWNDTTGILTIFGVKSDIIYSQILRSVRYINMKPFNPSIKTRTITFEVYDGDLYSNQVFRNIRFEDNFVAPDIPSGFTPNMDGVNDTWEIGNISDQNNVIVRVYDRRGILIYESKGKYQPWDGTYNGTLLSAGVYYYTIEYVKYQRKFSGTITILR